MSKCASESNGFVSPVERSSGPQREEERRPPPLSATTQLCSSWLPIQSQSVPRLGASQSQATESSQKGLGLLWLPQYNSSAIVIGDLVHRACFEEGLQDDKVTPVIWSSWTLRPKADVAGFSDSPQTQSHSNEVPGCTVSSGGCFCSSAWHDSIAAKTSSFQESHTQGQWQFCF